MTVYIEDSILENFFVTFFLLMCLNKLFVIKEKKIKTIAVCLFSGIIATMYPLLNLNGVLLIIFKLCIGILIVYFYSGKQKMLAKYITFMLLTALYAGINLLVYYMVYGTLNVVDNFTSFVLIMMLYLVYYLFNSCLSLFKKKFTIANFIYHVKIIENDKTFIDVGFLDSGNTLLDIDKSPIIIINFKVFNRIYKDIKLEDILSKNYKTLKEPHYVKSNFASGAGKILVFTVDKIEIAIGDKSIDVGKAKLGLVYSKFNKNFDCNMLLNINTFIN